MKRKKQAKSIDYQEVLLKKLKNMNYAAGYLTACYEEGTDAFLLGIKDVVEANGGFKELANETELNRENLYYMLSKRGNPRLNSLHLVLNKLGFEVSFKPKSKAA
ncbi:transcriptional regulator [bacterium]|nr:transcriptional regulator [bacterium]